MIGCIAAGWIVVLTLVLAVLRSLAAGIQTRRNLVLENLALRHQLLVLNRKVKSPALRSSDRIFWAALCATWSRWTKVLVIVQPETVVHWHQAGFRLFWRWKSRRRSGRTPCLRGRPAFTLRAILSNWRGRDRDTEIGQFSLNPRTAPGRIEFTWDIASCVCFQVSPAARRARSAVRHRCCRRRHRARCRYRERVRRAGPRHGCPPATGTRRHAASPG